MDSTTAWDRPEQEPAASSENCAPQAPETADTVRSAKDAEALLGIPVIACFPNAGEVK